MGIGRCSSGFGLKRLENVLSLFTHGTEAVKEVRILFSNDHEADKHKVRYGDPYPPLFQPSLFGSYLTTALCIFRAPEGTQNHLAVRLYALS